MNTWVVLNTSTACRIKEAIMTVETTAVQTGDIDVLHALFHGEDGRSASEAVILDQYKLYVDSMEKLILRRQGVHTFFMTVNTFLMSLAALLLTRDYVGHREAGLPIVLASLAGIVLAARWENMTVYYGRLAEAKFDVIHAFESRLASRPFWAEWVALRQGTDPKLYQAISGIEAKLPAVFGCCYIVTASLGVAIVFGLLPSNSI